ncbi:MAG: DegT/DnrJ/EryC1/StrS family aminotransferase [Alphaproteobacteria bacterium]
MSIAFIDLQAQRARISDKIESRIASVLNHGAYIMGPEVKELQVKLAEFGQAKRAIGCGNGTDAILLPLMAWNIGPGDAVFCPSFTFAATAEVIALRGATPVFIDIDRATYNICPKSLERAIAQVKSRGDLTPKAIIAVDLFGQPADYPALSEIAKKHDLKLIADSAQGFGCTLNGKHPLHWADVTTTSFFPAKPLGCYGDGGAVLTDDDALADLIHSLQVHGKGTDKYDNVNIGVNSRLDTLQAAILLEKLAIFEDEIEKRNAVAATYSERLKDHVISVPAMIEGGISTWAQYTIEVEDRDAFQAACKAKGVPTASYYPKPVHRQSAYADFPVEGNGLAHTDGCMDKVISLPMHPYLDAQTQNVIIEAVIEAA